MKSPKKVLLIGFDGANPELLRRYVDQGELPNFARLMERGVFSVALPSVPANTPVNWTSIATGAHPGTHGITDYWVHFPGEPLDGFKEMFRSELVQAEQLWTTAERSGRRALAMNYPGAHPWNLKDSIFVGGEGAPESGSRFEIKSGCCFVSPAAEPGTRKATVVSFQGDPSQARLELVPDKGRAATGVTYKAVLLEDAVEIQDEAGQMCATLRPGKWSRWLADRFVVDGQQRRGWFRFYLTELSADQQRFKLFVSQIFPETGWTVPDALGPELVERFGPYVEYDGAGPYRRGWHGIRAWYDTMRYKGHWMARAGSYLVDKYGIDLYYSHFHMLDHVFHYLWGGFDPATGWYDASRAAEFEGWMLEAHQIVDETLGLYMEQAGPDTALFVVSDHGLIPHIKAVSVNNLLAREGLIAWEPGPGNRPVIDWSRTLAFKPTDTVHIWINLKGRDPQGAVEPADYEAVQERIIDALLDLRDPENGKRPIALAVKKRDAAMFGLWGERVGDVVFMTNAEYSAPLSSPLSNDGRVVVKMGPEEEGKENFHSPDYQSYHGCTMPTVAIGRGGSEAGVLIMSGPGIKEGIRRDVPVRLIDVAPTIAHLLGLPQPAQADGRVLLEALE